MSVVTAILKQPENKIMPTRPTTPKIRTYIEVYNSLENATAKILLPKIWERKMDIVDKILFLKAKGSAKSDLWEEIYKEYPEIVGKTASVSIKEITFTK